jgi:SAM-dependent methyltransferase
MPIGSATPDLESIKARQRDTWASADYTEIGTSLQLTGETLCESVDVAAGDHVLDVAAGNGNATLAAARRGATVVATDYVDAVLAGVRARAAAEGLTVATCEADAERLPYADASFDVVLSTFGVMFTPHQPHAARELLRVTRPGGRIGLSNWTPTSFVGQMFRVVNRHVPSAPGVRSPFEWGTPDRLVELLGHNVVRLGIVERQFVFRYRSSDAWLDAFRTGYGPIRRAFASLDDDGAQSLEHDLLTLARTANTRHTTLRIPSDYLEIVAVRTPQVLPGLPAPLPVSPPRARPRPHS